MRIVDVSVYRFHMRWLLVFFGSGHLHFFAKRRYCFVVSGSDAFRTIRESGNGGLVMCLFTMIAAWAFPLALADTCGIGSVHCEHDSSASAGTFSDTASTRFERHRSRLAFRKEGSPFQIKRSSNHLLRTSEF